MPVVLVTTKLFHPTPRSGEVDRQRLYQKLDGRLSAGCPFFLVSAPPGFGKTTLISAWTRKTRLPTAWLSLDRADDEPFRFWRYVIAAFQTIFPELSAELVEALESPQPLSTEYYLPLLLNDLAALRSPFILVLDDFHLIEARAIHESLEEFLDHLPANGHVAVVTRSDPALHLARRRSRDQLCEVRVADLRFNSEETQRFFQQTMRLELSSADMSALDMRAEGWVTGLQLAAISLRDSANQSAFVSSFHGEDRFISDYLVEEVLQRQPETIQRFLMETSLLHRFNAALCNAVVLRNDSSEILARLESDNLFLIPLDTRREWFRYHHLFARLLNKKLELASGPHAAGIILRLASAECVRQGWLVEGVQYLMDAGDLDEAAELILDLSHQLFQQNELPTLMRWAGQLPENIVAGLPGLCIAFGWAAHATGKPELTAQYIQWVERGCGLTVEQFLGLPAAEQQLVPAQTLASLIEAVVMRARLLIDQGITRAALEFYMRILPWLVPERDSQPFANNSPSAMRPIMLFQAGLAYHLLGDARSAGLAYEESILLSRQQRNHFLVALGMGYLGQIQMAQGGLASAERTWRDALAYARENEVERDAFFSVAYVGLGSLAYERNDLEAAAQRLREGIRLARSWAAWQGLVPGYTSLAVLLQAKGDFSEALESLDALSRYQQSAPHMILPAEEAFRALLWSREGKARLPQTAWHNTLDRAVMLAEILIAAGQVTEAELLLDRLSGEAQAAGLDGLQIQILALKAKALLAQGRLETAVTVLEEALLGGEKEGYLRTFIDQGESIALLLRRVSRPELARYRARLLDAFAQAEIRPTSVLEQANAGLAEPLTRREMEILVRIAQGDDNAAIAAEYTISINTVKKHVGHLFEKLMVENRLQAVEKARRLGILM